MFDILQNLNKTSKKQNLNESAGNHTVSSYVASDVNGDGALVKNNQTTMRNILDSLNEELGLNGKKANYMPGTHKMGKLGANGKHPAGEYLVGGEEGEVPDEADEQLDEMGEEDAYGRPADNDSIRKRSINNMKGKAKSAKKHEMRGKGNPRQVNIGSNADFGIDLDEEQVNERGEAPAQKDTQLNEIGEAHLYHSLLAELSTWLEDFSEMAKNNRGSVQELYYAMADIVGQHAGDNSAADYPDDMMGEQDDDTGYDQDDEEYHKRYSPEYSADDDTGYDQDDDEMEESYDSESMTFKKKSVTEDDIDEDTIADKSTARKSGLHKERGTLKDVFKSMSETDEEKQRNMENEFHTELREKELTIGENGKHGLNETSPAEIDDKISYMQQLLQAGGLGRDDVREIASQIKKWEGIKAQANEPAQMPSQDLGPNDPEFNRPPEHKMY